MSDEAALVHALAARLGARVVETHISWVLLAGRAAYKVKKPVRLDFVDYRSPEARRRFCEEEVRLNRRLAPSLYEGVSRITGTPLEPQVDGEGPVLDYAVRMRRFADGSLFSELLAAGALEAGDVDALAALLAQFHAHAPVADVSSGFAEPRSRLSNALAGARAALPQDTAARIRGWLEEEASKLTGFWAARRAAGWVRECHGDLHLANLVRLDGAVAAFDGIEFDAALRWIDVLDDIAFPVMDLRARGRDDYAFRLLNAWLDRTGDHAGVPGLRFAAVYRALVRAEVALLRADPAEAARYAGAAQAWLQPATPRLFITCGLPGSGKTWQSQRLLEAQGAIRLRSDVERKRIHGLAMHDDSRAHGIDIYGPQSTARTYARLFTQAGTALRAGYPVILDAAFLRRAERDEARAVALSAGVPFSIVHCTAPMDVLRERVASRRGDASEAGLAELDKVAAGAEALAGLELRCLWRETSGQA